MVHSPHPENHIFSRHSLHAEEGAHAQSEATVDCGQNTTYASHALTAMQNPPKNSGTGHAYVPANQVLARVASCRIS